MARPILLLRLESPMQSWGTRSRWDVRDTGLEPTKSGIIGLLGCASGLSRGDPQLERLDRELLFGVRIDRGGVISTDYHTVTGYHRTAAGGFKHDGGTAKSLAKAREHGENTIVSPRDYLHDAAFLVGLAGDADLLARLARCLENPKWPLYLGRKSCVPSRPVFFDGLTDKYEDFEDAFGNEEWAAPRSRWEHEEIRKRGRGPDLTAWVECPDGDQERQDALRLNQLRFYDFRRCKRLPPIDASKLPWRTT